ncbi:TPA: glycosyltransferase family 4 protein [Enterococcus faecium]|nr:MULTISPECIES: glycosyltransferase family 4 protein [Enterococcus]EMF0319739.1 glycosyltransferase family 4 protein [Enterococcus faecium]MDQ8543281.1 glycosyltransferase family 4 protein [Enterococcus faecium]MDQ8555850.1 glycosyltransferase family 4 protein [Enterococcus faecium]NMF10632.1 glycosyltransferase family 4 protein [Enterococcus sp. 105332]HDO7744653.1 glycosyltransferase family 4 protein [Enterococcus faecium]
MKKALMVASVASMIDLFNMNNIEILQRLGYEVHVACNFEEGSITSKERVIEFKKELKTKKIKYFHIPIPRNIFKFPKILTSRFLLKKLITQNNYNLIHCHSPIGGVVARSAAKKFRKDGLKVIYTAHGFHFFKGSPIKNWILFFPIEKYYSKYTDLLITINKEDYRLANKKLHSKYNKYVPGIGIDVNSISKQNFDKSDMLHELGLNGNDFIITSVGQLSVRKNHQIIIKSLPLLENKKIKYIICGLGELETELKKLAENLGVSEQVVFTGYRQDVSKILSISDCFAFPSLQEGLPVALMEAMAIPLPIICSNIRGNKDLIINGKNGFLVNKNDENLYAEFLKRLIDNDNLKKQFENNNLVEIRKYDIEKINTNMEKIYSTYN